MNSKIIEILRNNVNVLINFEFESSNLNQRGIADYIESILCDKIIELNNNDIKVNEALSVRSIEDIEVVYDDYIYKIDIKTHDIDRDFSMPNLISIDRARKFLSNERNNIIYIFIDYKVKNNLVKIKDIKVQPIESLDWSYLSIQNLGKGQLQIKNMSSKLFFNDLITKEQWLNILIKEGEKYYEKLILKVSDYKNNWKKE